MTKYNYFSIADIYLCTCIFNLFIYWKKCVLTFYIVHINKYCELINQEVYYISKISKYFNLMQQMSA